MNKEFAEIAELEYEGYKIYLKASYFTDKKDAHKAMRKDMYFSDGKEYQAIVFVLEVVKGYEKQLYEDSLVISLKGDYKHLHLNYSQKKEELLKYAKEEIDKVLHENKVTENLETELAKAAIRQDRKDQIRLASKE